MIAWLSRLLFRIRTYRLARETELALELCRRGREKRQAAARKAAETRFTQRMEGLKR